jgi:hypothetical protein
MGSQLVAVQLRGWQLLVASDGTIAVSDLADQVRWSRQCRTQRFADEFGLSPKAAAAALGAPPPRSPKWAPEARLLRQRIGTRRMR